MKSLMITTLLFCTAAALGALAYLAYIENYAYKQSELHLVDLQQDILDAPLWRYGVVTAVDATSSTVTLTLVTGNVVSAHVPADAYIGEQELAGAGGIYNSLTAPVPATLQEVAVGSNAAAIIRGTSNGFYISMLLFGNPL